MDRGHVDYLWIIAVWTLILTAPIHCKGSIGAQLMWSYISPNLFWWKSKLIYMLDGLRVRTIPSKQPQPNTHSMHVKWHSMSAKNKLIVLNTTICITVDLFLRFKRGGALSSPNFTPDQRNLIEQEEYASRERKKAREWGSKRRTNLETVLYGGADLENRMETNIWMSPVMHLSIPSNSLADE